MWELKTRFFFWQEVKSDNISQALKGNEASFGFIWAFLYIFFALQIISTSLFGIFMPFFETGHPREGVFLGSRDETGELSDS